VGPRTDPIFLGGGGGGVFLAMEAIPQKIFRFNFFFEVMLSHVLITRVDPLKPFFQYFVDRTSRYNSCQ
jgi:hypothetical protein